VGRAEEGAVGQRAIQVERGVCILWISLTVALVGMGRVSYASECKGARSKALNFRPGLHRHDCPIFMSVRWTKRNPGGRFILDFVTNRGEMLKRHPRWRVAYNMCVSGSWFCETGPRSGISRRAKPWNKYGVHVIRWPPSVLHLNANGNLR
jgi:hypothetical protein